MTRCCGVMFLPGERLLKIIECCRCAPMNFDHHDNGLFRQLAIDRFRQLECDCAVTNDDDIESVVLLFKNSIESTNPVTDKFQREILHRVIVNENIDRYVKRQRQIKSLKSPFLKIKDTLHGIFGENFGEIRDEELIDLSSQDELHETSKKILKSLEYLDCITYFKDAIKNNLKRANNKWVKNARA